MPRTRANNGVGSKSKNGPVVVTKLPTFSDVTTGAAAKVTASQPKGAGAPTPIRQRTRKPRPAFPATAADPNPLAWRSALLIANGDASRLAVADDGSVLIRNYAV